MDLAEMQDIWDNALLRAWHQDRPLWKLYRMFIAELRLLGEEVPSPSGDIFTYILSVKLLRKAARINSNMVRGSEQEVTEWLSPRKPVRAFVAEQMPWLSNTLWAGKLSDVEIIQKMQAAGYTIEGRLNPVTKKKANESAYRKKRHKLELSRHRRLDNDTHRFDWNVVKGVRAKHS